MYIYVCVCQDFVEGCMLFISVCTCSPVSIKPAGVARTIQQPQTLHLA